jgi:hypothetical protein
MARMCVSLVELSLHTVMGRVPVLKYMLSGACRLSPYLRRVMSDPVPRCCGVGRAYPESGSL